MLFTHTDQRPLCEVSDLVLFGGSEEDLHNDMLSLVASDEEDWSGSVDDLAAKPD